MPAIAIDTQDGQRGVVSAQKQLAEVAAGTVSEVIGIPPNAETLIVVYKSTTLPNNVSVIGVTTSMPYIGVTLNPNPSSPNDFTAFFDVSSSIDEQVTVQFGTAPSATWWVYADAGVHVVADPATALVTGIPGQTRPQGALLVGGKSLVGMSAFTTDDSGAQYIIPTLPSTVAGDHPPRELLLASGNQQGNGAVVGGAGAGQRIRLFSASLMATSASVYAVMTEGATTGTVLFSCAPLSNANLVLPAQGYPLPATTTIWINVSAALVPVYYAIYYTVENI